MKKSLAVVFALLLQLFARSGFATPDLSVPLGAGYLDVDYFAGPANAANIAYFVVDFTAGGGATHAFAYRWDGNQTAADALLGPNGITNAGPLQVSATNFGGNAGLFINSFTDGSDFADPTGDDFWDYWLGTYSAGSANWAKATNYGISGTDVNGNVSYMQNGGFYGFRVDTFNENTFETDGGPPVAPIATVPEPATIVLMMCGLVSALWIARRVRVNRPLFD